jgi:uncharacterized protein (TIGR02246 family)
MKRLFLSGLLLCVASVAVGQTPTPRPGAGGPRTDLENDAEIRRLLAEFEAAWNRHDAVAMAALWTIDGDHLEPDGRLAKGRDEVQSLFLREHQAAFKETVLKVEVQTILFVTADVALVDGSYDLTGARYPQGNPVPARHGHLTAVMLEERSRWWVAASRLMVPVPLAWRIGEQTPAAQ